MAQKIPVSEIVNAGLNGGRNVKGVKFKNNEVLLIAARAMKSGMEIINPLQPYAKVRSKGKFGIGTVESDPHDIGKNLVVMRMEGAGFEEVDLGIEVAKGKFVEMVQAEKRAILGMSAVLPTTMVYRTPWPRPR